MLKKESLTNGIVRIISYTKCLLAQGELTEALRTSKTIDWRQKESARANRRRMVKRLLKKYKYPPEEQEAVLETVIKQCELYADNDEVETPIRITKPYQPLNNDFSIAAEP